MSSSAFPLLIALIMNLMGITVFVNPEASRTDTCFCSIVFALGVVGVLATVMRRFENVLCRPIQGLLEFLFALYALEFILYSFWFPLERSILGFIEKLTGDCETVCNDYENEYACQFADAFEWLHKSCLPGLLVCAIGTVITTSLLHMVRIIDVHVLFTCGPGAFVHSIKLPWKDTECQCSQCNPQSIKP